MAAVDWRLYLAGRPAQARIECARPDWTRSAGVACSPFLLAGAQWLASV